MTDPAADPAAESPRIAAFDVGDRRIGVALSDPLGLTAQPVFTLHRTSRRADLKAIARLLRKHHVAEAVVGNPLYMSGDQSPQAAKAQAFAADLRAEFALTVHLWDERLSTTQAHRHLDDSGHAPRGSAGARGKGPDLKSGGRKNIIDQVAAVLILQSWLDARSARLAREDPNPQNPPNSSSSGEQSGDVIAKENKIERSL